MIEFVRKLNWRNASEGPPVTRVEKSDLLRYENGIGDLVDAVNDGISNVELAYAETGLKVPLNTSGDYEPAAGLTITFATGDRPVMVEGYPSGLYGSDNGTWGLAIVRLSDGKVMAEGVSNTSPSVGYPPPPPLKFRLPANTPSDTYRLMTKRWDGVATGEINTQERTAYMHAVTV